MTSSDQILVVTDMEHLPTVLDKLREVGELILLGDVGESQLPRRSQRVGAVFTNPNKQSFFMGRDFMDRFPSLRVICSASTGTNHIDTDEAARRGIRVLSLARDFSLLRQITSTAELALALTLSSLRSLQPASDSVKNGEWNYAPFIGRQINSLKIGIIGLGRLGTMFAKFVAPLAEEVYFYDPFVSDDAGLKRTASLEELFGICDVISVHVHPTNETIGMINRSVLQFAKKDLLLVNTSRGEILNEIDVVNFLSERKEAKVAVDVLANETSDRKSSPLLKYSFRADQVLITPHIGGMTREAQSLAFSHAADKLVAFLQGSGPIGS